MINVYTVLYILFCHWISDFVLQSSWMALNKSTNWKALITHTCVYTISISFLLFQPFIIIPNWTNLLLFIAITFVLHTATDFFTSRINSRLYKKGLIQTFFISIGFDQWLHFAQLLLTITYLQ